MTFTSKDRVKLSPDPFLPELPFQLAYWNNSSLQEAMHCPRHYFYSTVRGLRRAGTAGGGVHLTFGSLVHGAVEQYSCAVGKGVDTETATEFALGWVLRESWPEGPCQECAGTGMTRWVGRNNDEEVGACGACDGRKTVLTEYDVFGGRYGWVYQCQDRTRTNTRKGIVRCAHSKAEHLGLPESGCPGCGGMVDVRVAYLCTEKTKNRRTLARSVVALCDRLSVGSLSPRVLPDGRIGAEYRWFRGLDLVSPGGTPYMMTGSFDGVATAPGTATVIPEYKTTQREPDAKFWVGYEMSPQVHTYTWGAQGEFGPGTRLMLFAIHVGVGFTEIYPKTVYISPGSLTEWESEIGHKVQEFELRAQLAQTHEAAGRDPAIAYPRNLAGCNSLPGAATTPCPFRDFCRLDPADREAFLASNFVVEHHNPLGKSPAAPEETE